MKFSPSELGIGPHAAVMSRAFPHFFAAASGVSLV